MCHSRPARRCPHPLRSAESPPTRVRKPFCRNVQRRCWWVQSQGTPGRSKALASGAAADGTFAPSWPMAFTHHACSQAPPPAAVRPRMPGESAGNPAATCSSRSFRPSTGATGRTLRFRGGDQPSAATGCSSSFSDFSRNIVVVNMPFFRRISLKPFFS